MKRAVKEKTRRKTTENFSFAGLVIGYNDGIIHN
jgi:hypothetical protein